MTPQFNRRIFIQGLAAAFCGSRLASGAATAPLGKKGWAGGDPAVHEQFKVRWHYNWTPRSPGSTTGEFVPLIKGAASMKQIDTIEKLPDVHHLLGFNEPERESQGNLSVNDALDLWPQLEAVAAKSKLRLGSPATSSDKLGTDWFDAFMEQAKKRKLRIDFIAAHWYRSRNAGAFETYLNGLSRAHRLPVWVTEFNGWNGPEDANFDFLKNSLRFLERSHSVERYAYFNPPKGQPHSLFAADGGLTRMGELYRDA